jgi:hypothetical protein
MKNLSRWLCSLLLLSSLAFTSCDPTEEYEIPTTYNFDNVNYGGQTQRLGMLAEIKSYLTTANTAGTTLDATKLKAMFANDAANAGFAGTYGDSKQLKSKTFENQQALFETLMEEAAAASQSTAAASNGIAGISTSADGAKKYLLSAGGVEYAQVIEKGLMGACFYYQSTSVYFGADKMNVDNETVTAGEGTAMEHHWDEAFGYFGAPIDFPTNTTGLYFWASYSNTVNSVLNTNQTIMDAFLKGRAAISNDDLETRDLAISEAQAVWEEIAAGSAIHYINVALANFSDDTRRNHALSEAAAFAYSLQFNAGKTVTNSQVNDVLALLGGSANFSTMNFYNATEAQLNTAKDNLAEYFNWEAAIADAL